MSQDLRPTFIHRKDASYIEITPKNGGVDSRVPKCARCRNHGVDRELKGHKVHCQYHDCVCSSCQVVVERQKITAARVAHLRHQRKLLKRGERDEISEYNPLTEEEEMVLAGSYSSKTPPQPPPLWMTSHTHDQGRLYKRRSSGEEINKMQTLIKQANEAYTGFYERRHPSYLRPPHWVPPMEDFRRTDNEDFKRINREHIRRMNGRDFGRQRNRSAYREEFKIIDQHKSRNHALFSPYPKKEEKYNAEIKDDMLRNNFKKGKISDFEKRMENSVDGKTWPASSLKRSISAESSLKRPSVEGSMKPSAAEDSMTRSPSVKRLNISPGLINEMLNKESGEKELNDKMRRHHVLLVMFPELEENVIRAVLRSCNYDLQIAVDQVLRSNYVTHNNKSNYVTNKYCDVIHNNKDVNKIDGQEIIHKQYNDVTENTDNCIIHNKDGACCSDTMVSEKQSYYSDVSN